MRQAIEKVHIELDLIAVSQRYGKDSVFLVIIEERNVRECKQPLSYRSF